MVVFLLLTQTYIALIFVLLSVSMAWVQLRGVDTLLGETTLVKFVCLLKIGLF